VKTAQMNERQSQFGKMNKIFVPNYSGLKHRAVFLVLFLVAFFVRLPFFFRDYIDRDESTFILMGQSWVDGNLPYTELWDLKPPITFLFFASIIYVFGKSFFAIRMLGVLIVAITAFFSYRIGAATDSKKSGYWAGLLCVFLLSLFGSLQGVMSEHICMVFFMPALYLMLTFENFWNSFLAGLLFGLAIMSKLNIVYAIFFFGIYMLYDYQRNQKICKGLINLIGLGLGILLTTLMTLLPYYVQGISEVWWNSVVIASLEYSREMQGSILKTLPFCVVVLLFLYLVWKKKLVDLRQRKIRLLIAAVTGILLMFVFGGKINGHYLIQFHPVFVVLFVLALGQASFFVKYKLARFLPFFLFLIPVESYKEYYDLVKHKIERGSFYNGEGITVPNYLFDNKLQSKSVLFFEYHIGYWPLDKHPPTKASTHPSNMLREAIFPILDNPRKTGFEELQYIMETKRPEIVVTRKDQSIFDETKALENLYIHTYLAGHYELLETIDKADIYLRLEQY